MITNCEKQVEGIKTEMLNMKNLWDHIKECLLTFDGYMDNKWVSTNPFDMDEQTKGLMKVLKDMKVDRRCNAYVGIMEEIKKWLVFLPLIGELRDEAMRERHWTALKEEVK
jgi:dynein heavy chain